MFIVKKQKRLFYEFFSLIVLSQFSLMALHNLQHIDNINKIEMTLYHFGGQNLTESSAYSIQLFSDKDSYDHGEEVLINAYITGGGSIEESKLIGHISESLLSGQVQVELFRFGTSLKGEWEGYKPIIPRQIEAMPNRFIVDLSEGYFTYRQETPILWSEGDIRDPDKNIVYPPISIRFSINNDAPSGDHKIEFIFKYKSTNDEWEICEEVVIIHIKSLVEKYAIAISALCTAIIGGCIAVISWVLSKSR